VPLTKISLRKGKNPEYKQALMFGIHSALVEAFSVPDSEIYQQIYELDTNDIVIHSSKSNQLVVIEIIAIQGRSIDAKRKLYRAIVANLSESLNIPADEILIILQESPADNWGLKDGKPASEVDSGFKVEL
jgi:phenylpyruvate tautomerase PptA (4-oxalocrotonate tautomerase family)